MKFFWSFFLFFFVFPLCAQPLNPLVNALADRPVLQGASWAAAAAYTDGEPLISVRPQLRLAPASTLKLLTTAAALDAFGPFHRFETRLYADALPDQNGVLHGNLYVRGGGDPTLGSARVTGSLPWQQTLAQWALHVKAAGIRRVTGRIYGDVSLFEGPSVPVKTNWQNMGNYYAAPASPLSINDNSFTISFHPQPQHGQNMRVQAVSPQIAGLTLRSFVTADAQNPKDNAYVYGAPEQYSLEIYGTLPASRFSGYKIDAAMPDPAQTLLNLFDSALEKEGIEVTGAPQLLPTAPDYTPMTLLHTHHSPPMKDIIYIVNKRSFNFYAEMLLRHLAVHAGKKGSVQAGVEELYKFLQKNGIDTQNMRLYDGSGLSRDNQITAQTLLDILILMSRRADFKYYYASLATPQDRGDLLLLRRFLAPFKRVADVRVKGGTIDGVKAMAGYVKNQTGRDAAFCVMANNLVAQDESINRFYEALIKALLQLPDGPAQP